MAVVKRRLLIVTAVAGSLSRLVVPQVAALTQCGWDVHLASAPDVSGDLDGTIVQHHAVESMTRTPGLGDVRAIWQMRQLIRTLRPEVVMGGTPKGALVSMLASRETRTPVRIYHVRGARWERESGVRLKLYRTAERLTARASTDVLSVSDSLADLMVEDRIVGQRPTVLGAGGSKGVDLDAFTPRGSYPASTNSPAILALGRLTPNKGVEATLEVFGAIQSHYPAAKLTVIGGEDSIVPLPPSVHERLRGDGITVMGRIPQAEVARRLKDFDLLVFPSTGEGLPNSVIECAAAGVPTVGWQVTGVVDAVSSGVTGETVPFGETHALTSAALKALEWNRAHVADQCRHWATRFDSDQLARMLNEFLSERAS